MLLYFVIRSKLFFCSYPVDSPELQQRKLGDLAFLVQHYELAFNSYHAAKREFNNDHAWLYFAGALVSCVICYFPYLLFRLKQKIIPVFYYGSRLDFCRLKLLQIIF